VKNQARILIVEDNAIAAKAVQSILGSVNNCYSDIAVDGKQAIALVQEHDYDIILMDIGLPDMNGIEVTRRILALNSKAPPIVALTSHGQDPKVKEEASLAGMQEVLAKPLSKQQLEMLLQKYCSYDSIG
jgi:CheY-like chemotaxis protein